MRGPSGGFFPPVAITRRFLGLWLLSLSGCALLEAQNPDGLGVGSLRPASVSDTRDAELKAVLAHLMQIAQSRDLEAFKSQIRPLDRETLDPLEGRALMTSLAAHKVRDFRVERNGEDEAHLRAEASGNPNGKAISLTLALEEGLWKIVLSPRPMAENRDPAESRPDATKAQRKGKTRGNPQRHPAQGTR